MGGFVSEVGSLLGGGNNNSQFQATSANILNPTTVDQSNAAYGQSQNALMQQQQLANALGAQNGIGNQSSVYNQLQGVANGTGPNPATAQLAQATSANTANQAALMAGQRGVGANVGLLARQAAQQGAANQQNAIGQAATLQAQQQLGALGQLGGLATQQVAQQQNAVSALNSGAQNEQSQILGGIQGQNNAIVSNQSNINNANSGLAQTNANNAAKFTGGELNSIGGAVNTLLSGAPKAYGGLVEKFADGGVPTAIPDVSQVNDGSGGGSSGSSSAMSSLLPLLLAAANGGIVNPKVAQVPAAERFSGALAPHIQHIAEIYHPQKFAGGGKVNSLVSPGEVYLSPEKAKEVARDGKNPLKEGKKVPGEPKVKGNSYANDVVPAKLQEGGVVIPNSIMQSSDPAGNAAAFVKKLVEKSAGQKEQGDFKDAVKKAIASRKAS